MKFLPILAVMACCAASAQVAERSYRCDDKNSVSQELSGGCKPPEGWAALTWKEVGKTLESTFYMATNTKRRSGSMVKMWVFNSLKEPRELRSGKTYHSIMMLDEYDCKRLSTRSVFQIGYEDASGAGEIVISFIDPNVQWMAVEPQSAAYQLLLAACEY